MRSYWVRAQLQPHGYLQVPVQLAISRNVQLATNSRGSRDNVQNLASAGKENLPAAGHVPVAAACHELIPTAGHEQLAAADHV